MLETKDVLYAFEKWGFKLEGESDTQYFGVCPFCEKPGKFYLHKEKSLWDCKVCSISGNYLNFLEKVLELSKKELGEKEIGKLSVDRGLPVSAFKQIELGFWDGQYLLPVRNEAGKLQDLRSYVPGKKMLGAKGCKVGLWGIRELVGCVLGTPVYVCEGEWDGVALNWFLKFMKQPGCVVAVPGAGTFKTEWLSFFQGHTVYLCYDNDNAGEAGELLAQTKLTGVAKLVYFLHWSSGLPRGFDIRDLLVKEVIQAKKPNRTLKAFKAMFKAFARRVKSPLEVGESSNIAPGNEVPPEPVALDEVNEVFNKWLFLKDLTAIEMMLATVLSNNVEGDPLWLFLVAPPGGAKTEIISSLSIYRKVYFTSSLTPHSLISGSTFNGKDPSLIPFLDGMTLGIKDFTTVLDGKESDKDEIFGILRDAFDGTCGKVFGNGIRRVYKSKFTVISGVTEKIYRQGTHQHALGERFLKYCIEGSLNRPHETHIIARAISNISKEGDMKKELAEVVNKFLEYYAFRMKDRPLPTIPTEYQAKLVHLAMYGARMRGVVSRDKYRSDLIDSRPSAEIGSRLGKQLAKLMICLALVNGRDVAGEHEYDLARKTMLDTISQRNEDIVAHLVKACPTVNDSVKTRDLSFMTSYTQSTIARVLADLAMLKVVVRTGPANAYSWTVSPDLRNLIDGASLYISEKEKPKLNQMQVIKSRIKL